MTVIQMITNHDEEMSTQDENNLESPKASLAQFPPFVGLADSVLDVIAKTADYRQYKTGETLVSQGQYEGEAFFIIAQGEVRVTVVNPQTGAVYMETIEAGSSFGLDIALAEENEDIARNVTLTAEKDSAVWVVDALSFADIVSNRPSLAKNLLFFLSTEFLKSRFSSFEFKTAPEQRVYEELLSLVERNDITGVWEILNMPKHRELAESASVEEEDAANAVAHLIQVGIANREYPGLVISDMAGLNRLAK